MIWKEWNELAISVLDDVTLCGMEEAGGVCMIPNYMQVRLENI